MSVGPEDRVTPEQWKQSYGGTSQELTELQCTMCIHYRPGLRCSAFPGGIPMRIVKEEFDHRNPYPGDHGIQWSPKRPGLTHPLEGRVR